MDGGGSGGGNCWVSLMCQTLCWKNGYDPKGIEVEEEKQLGWSHSGKWWSHCINPHLSGSNSGWEFRWWSSSSPKKYLKEIKLLLLLLNNNYDDKCLSKLYIHSMY